MKKYNIKELTPISIGTNETYIFEYNSRNLVLKKRVENDSNLSSFWFHQKELYGLTYESYIKSLNNLYLLLKDNDIIKVPELIDKNYTPELSYQVFECVEGESWEPDEFPSDIKIAEQLGQYIGKFHSVKYDNFGTIVNHTKNNFKKCFFGTMRKQIEIYFNNSPEMIERLEYYEKIYQEPKDYSLIMTDISGNQFIYNDEFTQIKANVDLDAYVIGPRDLELTIIKDCLTEEQFDIFRNEYQLYTKFDDLNNIEVYKFYFSLCDVSYEYKESIKR